MLENGYWCEGPGGGEFPTSPDKNHAAGRVSKLSSESIGSEFCANNNGNNSSLGRVPRAENGLSFLDDDPYDDDDGKHSCDLFLDHGWPELGNFYDVDTMFGSCGDDDNLGWFSSLDAIEEEGCGEGERPDFNWCLSPNALKMISGTTEDAIDCSGVTDPSGGGDSYGGNPWGPEDSCVPSSAQWISYRVGPTFPDEKSVGKNKKQKKHIDMDGGGSMKAPMELDGSSTPSSLSSEESNCFRHLQHVMKGIDLKTRLCIRDSLYRLARGAEQRNRHPNLNGDASGDLIANSKRCVGFVDMETDTNPMDRSIAHLLFHRS